MLVQTLNKRQEFERGSVPFPRGFASMARADAWCLQALFSSGVLMPLCCYPNALPEQDFTHLSQAALELALVRSVGLCLK